MSYPFQRRDSSPRTPEYFSRASSPGRLSPLWKGTRKRLWDSKRNQIVAGILAFAFTIWLLRTMFVGSDIQHDGFLDARSPTVNHFQDYQGGLECRLSSQNLYKPPIHDTPQARKAFPYCKNRETLLEALSNGGRHGFDVPYTPQGCHYKWYSSLELCMLMDRFDAVVFVGDDLINGIYAAFNMLLRQDIELGALEDWRMTEKERGQCRCDHQYSKAECVKYWVSSSDAVAKGQAENGPRSPFRCNRAPHYYYPIAGPSPPDLSQRFSDLLAQDPSSWKPIPIIHSLGISTTFNWQIATESMDEWLTIADSSGRNTPFLWVGPNAAGHLKPPSKILQEGNNALWHYTTNMAKEAGRRGVEAMNFYNMTLQAYSFDGSSYGEGVALTQAMMIFNWLARLETT